MLRLLAIAAVLWPLGARAELAFRVRVAGELRSVELAGEGLRRDGRPVASPWQARVPERPVRVSANGPIRVGESPYPGEIVLVPDGRGRMDVVNLVELERYTAATVGAEVYPSWPAEVLKAQAVAVRSYALHQRRARAEEPWDLDASVVSQRYGTGPVAGPVREAVAATSGEYLSFAGQPILAAFHASSGGRTATAAEVWGDPLPYLRTVESPDDAAPDYFWSYEIDRADLAAVLSARGHATGPDPDVRVEQRTPSGRVGRLAVGRAIVSGHLLRQLLGGRAIKSAMFDVRLEGERVRFLGSGAGHGVGLCQWGARELAVRGLGYREILEHYYPGTALARVDGRAADREWSARP